MKMKLILLPLFVLAACTQMEQPEQTVTFEIGSVKEEGSMTKADILPLIRKPSEVQLLLTNLSNGKSQRIDIGAVPIICAKLGVTADYLFGISDNPTPDASRQAIADKAREIIEMTKSL